MYTLRNIARRGTMLAGAGALAFASLASGSSAFADALNPLTHRSLTLTSSSPGWSYTDGSGNATYAPPNSGANGQKTGNTFSFNVSTDSSQTGKDLRAMTFQYCTKSAGDCYAPGNDVGAVGSRTDSVTNRQSDLNVVTDGTNVPREMTSAEYLTHFTSNKLTAVPAADDSAGNFVVLTETGGNYSYSANWHMKAETSESNTDTAQMTGKNNLITIWNDGTTGAQPHAGDGMKIIFFATDDNYITNPGEGEFFVKINDFSGYTGDGTGTPIEADQTKLVDGGVTVANVMNQSIQITTKVLETMDFSVGTVDPDTLSSADGSTSTQSALQKALGVAPTTPANNTKHGTCDGILTGIDASDVAAQNVLQLGDTSAEDSLSTAHTYSTHSYWRLSSNSSAGASVYYSGVTLENTVGDNIDPIGVTARGPQLGTEQFGLALADGTNAQNSGTVDLTTNANAFPVDYTVERAANFQFENGADNGVTGVDASTTTDTTGNAAYHNPRLYPIKPDAQYEAGAGVVNTHYGSVDTMFAFDPNSNTIPAEIATESNQVVDCVTGKMRYIANIAATTPAGIYTTKINYIAAPQY